MSHITLPPATYRNAARLHPRRFREIGADQATLRLPSGQQVELYGADVRGKSLNSPLTGAFEVDDIAEAREALVAAGIEIVGEVGSWEGHEWLYFRSPDGYLFEVKKTLGSGLDDR